MAGDRKRASDSYAGSQIAAQEQAVVFSGVDMK